MINLNDPTRSNRSLFEAQELIYDAWEEESAKERIRLAKKALKLSPLCADAITLLAEDEATTLDEKIVLYKEAVGVGKKALGKDFDDFKGHFWGHLEARPYMRARRELAVHLWLSGDKKEAVGHLKAMLELNPGDNQGLRLVLVNWLFVIGDLKAVKKLIADFSDNFTATWAYSKLLLELADSQGLKAEKLLKEAMKLNAHIPRYLCGEITYSEEVSHAYALGSEEEAAIYAMDSTRAWESVPKALLWLCEQAK